MSDKIFCAGIALLATHELDAMTHREWEILLPFLDSEAGRLVFVLLHIPIFYFLFYFSVHKSVAVQKRFKFILAVFFIIHGLAHLLASRFNGSYTFVPPVESITVYGATICGLAFLWIENSPRSHG
jgi:hypothetical protein